MKKSIFLFFAAILCATNAWGAKLFFDHSSVNYPADGALVAIWSWGGSSSDAWSVFKASGATNKIVADIADGRTGGKIVRFNSSVTKPDWNASQWNSTGDISFPKDKNCIKITKWDGATSGTWSTFQLDSKASVTPSASSVSVGEEVTFTPALTSNQEYNDVLSTTYSVDAGATITDGKFVATEAGTYTVTATVTYNAQGYTNITKTTTATCSITVSEVAVPHPVTGVTIAPTSVTIKQGATTTLTATVSPSNADDPSVIWSSDNQSVATVVNGVVTAVAPGTANITVTTVDGGFTATCAVKVKPSQYTFHAINSAQWPTVAAHYWGGADGGSSWPGADMVKESETVNGCDIYSITISSDFINIMFTNQLNGDDKNKKTADLTTEGNDGKYYDIKDAKWYASLSEIPVSYDYYITGSFNSNNPKNAENGMTLDGEVYKATVTLAEGDNTLKVTDGTWDKTWGANELGAAYEEVSNPNDYNNIKIALAAEKEITVIFDATAGKITFEGLTPYVAPLTYTVTVPAGTEKCFIAGVMNGWNFQEMTATANANEFTIDIAGARESDGYKYACQASWDYVEKKEDGNDLDANRTWKANDVVAKWGVPPTYTIVGATAITGANWDLANEANKMIKDGEAYTLTKTGLKLETGDYEYKVAKNGAWGDGQYPAEGNQKVTITETAEYTIVYTYTVGTSLTAVATKTGEYTPAQTVYTVVGDAALCGTDWKADDAANDMTANGDGTYTWTKADVKLTSNVGFKVVKNHDFGNGEYPAENWNINLVDYEDAAVYTVTITFTESSKEIAVTLTKTGEATPPVITYVLMGVNGDWDNGIALTQNPDNEDEYVLENQVIIKATDAVKVVTLTDGTASAWCGNVDSYSNATYTADAEGNIVLEDGIYTFYFKKSTDNIYINQTGYARNVTNKYGTICLPYASASTTGAYFYEVAGKEEGKVYLASVDALVAGVPYIFEKTANQIKVVYTGEKTPTAASANGLVGTFVETTVPDGDYILYNNAFCTNESAGTLNKIKENRAYLDMDAVTGGAPQQMPGRRYIGMDVEGENEATGFENITNGENTTIKLIENGQLIIIRNGEKFNAMGVRL